METNLSDFLIHYFSPTGAYVDDSEDADKDPLSQDAMRLMVEFGKTSTSLLQRRLAISYGGTAHLIDSWNTTKSQARRRPSLRGVKRPDWIDELEQSMR